MKSNKIGNVYRAIITVNGSSDEQCKVEIERGIEEIRELYDSESEIYIGNYEGKQFKKLVDKWNELGNPEKNFTVDSNEHLANVSFFCELEYVPCSQITKDGSDNCVIVIGPCEEEFLNKITKYCN